MECFTCDCFKFVHVKFFGYCVRGFFLGAEEFDKLDNFDVFVLDEATVNSSSVREGIEYFVEAGYFVAVGKVLGFSVSGNCFNTFTELRAFHFGKCG